MAMDDEFGSFSYGKTSKESDEERAKALAEARRTAYRETPPEPAAIKNQYTGAPASATPWGPAVTNASRMPYEDHRDTGYISGAEAYPPVSRQRMDGPSGPTGPTGSSGSAGNNPEKGPGKKTVKKSGNGKRFLLTAGLALVFGVVASGTFIGMNKLFKEETTQTKESSATTATTTSSTATIAQQQTVNTDGSTTTVSYDVAEIVKKAQPSIVSITTTVTTSYQYYFQQYEQESTGAGSGIIIGESDDYLYIATNYHVIEGAKKIQVGFNDGTILEATVTGYDSSADVAVVQVPENTISDETRAAISIAVTGDSDALQVGEPAIAIGNALGYGQSVTVGYISALNRAISGSEGSYIQTDAAINPGNSGGALFNAKGEVIGINSVKYVDSKVEGMGFSIPINKALSIIDNLIKKGTTGKVYLGISGADVTRDYSQIYGFPIGIYVKEVSSGGPAEKAGLHTGDIITAVGSKELDTMEELKEELQKYSAGDRVSIRLYRANNRGQYEEMTLEATLAQE